MESLGLMPSNTGEEGGKRTGDLVSHYILDAGAFDKASVQLLTQNFVISWFDRFAILTGKLTGGGEGIDQEDLERLGIDIEAGANENKSNRVKYSHICEDNKTVNVWGKPGLKMFCGVCGLPFDPFS